MRRFWHGKYGSGKFWRPLSAIVLLLALPVLALAQADSPQPPFPEFRKALEKRLADRGFDPQRHTFHFVVLMDNSHSSDPNGIDAIVKGLLDHYLVAESGASDAVSFAPFQLTVLTDHAHWNLPYTPENVTTIREAMPLGPVKEGSYIGGDDKEGALLLALRTLKGQGCDPRQAIYIVLSANVKSSPPGSPKGQNAPNYPLTYQSQEFTQIAGPYGMADVLPYDTLPTPNAGLVSYRIYLPTGFQPLGPVLQTSRDKILASRPASVPPPPSIAPVVPPPVEPIAPVPPTPVPVGAILGGLLALTILGGGLGYYLWLRAPRNVQIGPTPGSVRHGRPTYLEAQGEQAILSSKTPGTPVARLEVAPNGDVVMHGESFYVLPNKNKVILTNTSKTYWLKHNETGEDIYEINARRVR